MFTARTQVRSLAAAVGLLFASAALSAQAHTVNCNDGTTSRSDVKAPCSNHGGIKPAPGSVAVNAPPGRGSVAVNAPPPKKKAAAPTVGASSAAGAAAGPTPTHVNGRSPTASKAAGIVTPPDSKAGGIVTPTDSKAGGIIAPTDSKAGGIVGPTMSGGKTASPRDPASSSPTKIMTPASPTISGNKGATSPVAPVVKPKEGAIVGPTMTPPQSSPGTASGTDKSANNKAEGATAKCKDGTYSHDASHTHACAGHQGATGWLTQPPR